MDQRDTFARPDMEYRPSKVRIIYILAMFLFLSEFLMYIVYVTESALNSCDTISNSKFVYRILFKVFQSLKFHFIDSLRADWPFEIKHWENCEFRYSYAENLLFIFFLDKY